MLYLLTNKSNQTFSRCLVQFATVCILTILSFLPLDKAIASRALFGICYVIVSRADGNAFGAT